MKVVGLTGGIGSGKTSVAKLFLDKGVPVYFSDDRAKHLMHSSVKIKNQLIDWYGDNIYKDNQLDRKLLASFVFNNKKALENLNELVHPVVFKDFETWIGRQNSDYVIKEAAILFESGAYKRCDKIIVVTATLDIRIERVIERDNITETMVRERLANQWTDDQRLEKADYIIKNDSDFIHLEEEVDKLYSILESSK